MELDADSRFELTVRLNTIKSHGSYLIKMRTESSSMYIAYFRTNLIIYPP